MGVIWSHPVPNPVPDPKLSVSNAAPKPGPKLTGSQRPVPKPAPRTENTDATSTEFLSEARSAAGRRKDEPFLRGDVRKLF